MQILTSQQVKYCNVAIEKLGELNYLPGMSFQNKIFTKRKFFPSSYKQNAVDYCKHKYLAAKGSKSYVLVEDITGFTVWMEDELAQIIGTKKPESIIKNLDLEDIVAKMRNVEGIKIKDRKYNLRTYSQCFVGSEACEYLIDALEISLEEAIHLGQKLIDEKWIHHVADEQPFQDGHFFYRFYWDEV